MKVRAAGVNPVDWKFREGAVGTDRQFPLALGWDVAGEVVATATADGPDVGDEVYGMLPLPHGGAYQEFAVLPASAVAPKPAGLSFAQAAAVPLAALTAWQALNAAHVASGQRVLVHAGGGGVGHFAVQLAKARGAHRLTTQVDFLRRLGVDEPVDRTSDSLHTIEPVHAVIDTVGGRTQRESWPLLRPGGTRQRILKAYETVAGCVSAACGPICRCLTCCRRPLVIAWELPREYHSHRRRGPWWGGPLVCR